MPKTCGGQQCISAVRVVVGAILCDDGAESPPVTLARAGLNAAGKALTAAMRADLSYAADLWENENQARVKGANSVFRQAAVA